MFREGDAPGNRAMGKTLLSSTIHVGHAVVVMKAANMSRYSGPTNSLNYKIFYISVKGESIILEIHSKPRHVVSVFNKIHNARDLVHGIYFVLQIQQPQDVDLPL